MTKSAAAVYAQLRRDNENDAREALKPLIPEQYHTAEVQNNGEFNASTKVFVAAKNFLSDLTFSNPPAGQSQNLIEKLASNRDVDKTTPFSIPRNKKIDDESADEQMNRLRQVATRLVQKAEEKVQAKCGKCQACKAIIETANDQMIDIIEAIEKVK